jgi:anti-anti-sigma factor
MALRVTLDEPDRFAVRCELLHSEVRRSDDHALIMLAGELDTSTAGQLYIRLAELARLGVRHVALNLAELTFLDSTGLSVLVSEHKRVESMGGELIVFSPCPRVRRVFEITGLSGYLNLRPVVVAAPNKVRGNKELAWECSSPLNSMDGGPG